jgi:hypothetical protein
MKIFRALQAMEQLSNLNGLNELDYSDGGTIRQIEKAFNIVEVLQKM